MKRARESEGEGLSGNTASGALSHRIAFVVHTHACGKRVSYIQNPQVILVSFHFSHEPEVYSLMQLLFRNRGQLAQFLCDRCCCSIGCGCCYGGDTVPCLFRYVCARDFVETRTNVWTMFTVESKIPTKCILQAQSQPEHKNKKLMSAAHKLRERERTCVGELEETACDTM